MSEANSETLVQIAKVLKSHGTDGGILLGFRGIHPDDINLTEPVFINFDGLPVPFFIESLSRKGNGKAIAHLSDIYSFEEAEEIAGRAVFAEEGSIERDEDEDALSLESFIGWTLWDKDKKIGEIVDYEDIPGNPCLYTETEGRRVLIPLHEDFVLSLDSEERTMKLNLPEGLF